MIRTLSRGLHKAEVDHMANKGTGARGLAVMMAALMFGGLFALFVPNATMVVSATDLPSEIYGDWYVSGTERYDGGNCILYGNLYVQNGGNLVLNNLTLGLGNSYDGEYYINVDAGGILRIFNSTIQSGTGLRSYFFDTYGTLQIENSTVQDFGNMWWWQGVDIYGMNTILKNSTFNNNDIGLNLGVGGTTIEDCIISNSIEMGIWAQSGTVTARNITFTGNQGSGGYGAASAMWGGSLVLYDSTIKGNTGSGVYIEDGGTVDLYNSTVTNNNVDIQIYSWGTMTVVNSYNSKYGTKSIQDWGGGNTAILKTYWYANISAIWESDGAGVADGTYSIMDKNDGQVTTDILDSNGKRYWIPIKESEEKAGGKTTYTPHKFNITGDRSGKVRTDVVSLDIKKNTNVNFVLDDVPPVLNITSPADGYATNQTSVELTATTEIKAKSWVDGLPVVVDPAGIITSVVQLDTEGKNNIKVRVQDALGNERSAEVNVTRDTIVPMLTIDQPVEDDLFNYSNILVSGKTEVGATLSVNSKSVPVGADGNYNTTLTLPEGANTVTVWSQDSVLNRVTLKVTFMIDKTAPTLSIGEPVEGFRTKDTSIRVAGVTEPKSIVSINGVNVPLSGSMFQMSVNLAEGSNTITVKSCDKAKNCKMRLVNGTRDSIPPTLKVTAPPTQDEVLTKQASIDINGSTEPGAKVTINNKEVVLAADGSFTYEFALKEGDNVITIVTADDYGNTAQATRKVRRDSVDPTLEVITPGADLRTKEKDVEITGNIEIGAILTINDQRISFTGTLFARIMPLENEGENNFTVMAMDKAGNFKVVKLKVMRDTQVLLNITNPVSGSVTTNETVAVEGFTDPRAEVEVNDIDLVAGTNGKFRVLINLTIGDNEITIKTKDDLGNTKTTTVTVVREKKADPPKPVGPGGSGNGWLLPLILIVVVIAAVGGGVGIYMMRKKKKEQLPPPQQPVTVTPQQGYGGQMHPGSQYGGYPPAPPPQYPPSG